MIRSHANKATGIAARLYHLNIISSRTFKDRLFCCFIRRAVCAILRMAAGIALHDGRAIVCAVHTSDESTGRSSALHINGGCRVLHLERSVCHEADEATGDTLVSGCHNLHFRIIVRIIVLFMVVCEDSIHRQICTRPSEKHTGICCRSILWNFVIS